MIYYFRVTGARDTALDYADLLSITLRKDDVQEFDTDGMKFFCLRARSHLMMSWKACTN